MTIKKRLFVSNLLMIVLPMLLTIVMSLVVAMFLNLIGTERNTIGQNRVIFISASEAENLLQKSEYSQVTGEVTIYQADGHGYVLVLPDGVSKPHLFGPSDSDRTFPLLAFFMLLAIVLVSNYLLTRYVFRSIMSPIHTIVQGVHEIRDGNLTYRIEYPGNDEFAAVCADFNEMAAQLWAMVTQQQKDEQNRRELIAGISHDLRTPLTSIKAYIEGLEKGVAATPEMQQKYLSTIKEKAAEQEYLIHQLLLFSKLDIGEFPFNYEHANIGEALQETRDGLVDEYREKGLTVIIAGNVESAICKIDIVQFRNVIYNILNNSVKYKDKEQAQSIMTCRDEGAHVGISISDNGPGVPEAQLDKLFEVFYRGDASRRDTGSGSGLGLAIAAKIVERFGGTIRAENVVSGGLCIVFTLPIEKGVCGCEENPHH